MGFGSYNFRCPSATCFGVVLINMPMSNQTTNHPSSARPSSLPLNRMVDLETFHEMLQPLIGDFRKKSSKLESRNMIKNNIFENIALVIKLKKIAQRTTRLFSDPQTGRFVVVTEKCNISNIRYE